MSDSDSKMSGGRRESNIERREPSVDPPLDWAGYRSTGLRAPRREPLRLAYGPNELSGPSVASLVESFGVREHAADLTRQHSGEPLGERIIVHGRVLDAQGRPLPEALVEIWQANASGRYRHAVDQHPAPLDPNFGGAGFCVTDSGGRFRFVTIKPGAYPWKNHANAWRPAHVHFSVLGRAISQRLITQMYFPGDPLFEYDPIFNSVPAGARQRLIAAFDLAETVPEWALGFRFDVILGGRAATPFETAPDAR
jgi:protocatechuate 3,4-dioxygenase, beta subunit